VSQADDAPDPGGLAFEELAGLGERTDIRFGRITGEAVDWVDTPHARCDGLGALARLLRRDGHTVALPTLSPSRRPGFLRTLWAILRHDPGAERRPCVPWRRFEGAKAPAGPASRPAWRLLQAEASARIEAAAEARGVSGNSLLLSALDRAAAPRLVREPQPSLWLMPVNMRGAVKIERDTQNQSSFLPVAVPRDGEPEAVHGEVRRLLSAQVHWAAWAVAVVLPRWVSRARYSAYVKKYHARPGHPWLGTFSNLGAWDVPDGRDGWVFAPPTARTVPLAAGAITLRGRLGLALDAHPVLDLPPGELFELLDAWIDAALRG